MRKRAFLSALMSAAPLSAAMSRPEIIQVVDRRQQSSGRSVEASTVPSRASAVRSAANPDSQVLKTFGYSSAGDGGGALYKKVVSEPSHAGKLRSADGVWWELAEQVLSPQMFGAKGDGVTDDWPAFQAMFAMRLPNGKKNAPKGPKVFIPSGAYKLASIGVNGIQLKAETHIQGEHGGMGNAFQGTELIFPADCVGICVNRFDTIDGGVESAATGGADGSSIRNIAMTGALGSDLRAHGIWLRARATVENVTIRNFTGDGVHIRAGARASASVRGNANSWFLNVMRVQNCGRDGYFVDGADANSGLAIGCSAQNNGRWGFYDSSFLGNTWVGCHSAGNGTAGAGINGSRKSSFVHFNGFRYGTKARATQAELVAIEPGSNDKIWIPLRKGGAHAVCPTWLPDQADGTYFHGGAYKSDNANASNVFLGCYTEGGQAGCSFAGPTLAIGGSIYGAGFMDGGYIRGDVGNRLTVRGPGGAFAIKDNAVDVLLGGGADNVLQWLSEDETASSIWRFHRSGKDWVIDNANSGSRTAMRLTGEHTEETSGRSTTIPYHATFPRIGIGSGKALRLHSSLSAEPSSGEYGRGEVIYNSSPSAAGVPGWVCTIAGTAGSTAVFKAMAALAD